MRSAAEYKAIDNMAHSGDSNKVYEIMVGYTEDLIRNCNDIGFLVENLKENDLMTVDTAIAVAGLAEIINRKAMGYVEKSIRMRGNL